MDDRKAGMRFGSMSKADHQTLQAEMMNKPLKFGPAGTGEGRGSLGCALRSELDVQQRMIELRLRAERERDEANLKTILGEETYEKARAAVLAIRVAEGEVARLKDELNKGILAPFGLHINEGAPYHVHGIQ